MAGALEVCEIFREGRYLVLNVEAEVNNVAIFHNVLFPL